MSLLENFRNWMDAKALTFLSVVFGKSTFEDRAMRIERYFEILFVRLKRSRNCRVVESNVRKLYTSHQAYSHLAMRDAIDASERDPLASGGWSVMVRQVAHHELLALRCELMSVEVMMNVPERAKR